MAENESGGGLITVTGLWLNETRDGRKFMKGYFGNAEVLIFKNEKKTEEKHPDYNLCIGKGKPKKKAGEGGEGEGFGDDVPF